MKEAIRSFLDTSAKYLFTVQEPKVIVKWAQSQHEIMLAQMLRYEVFTQEYRADIKSNIGCDIDGFDAYCKHLIAVELSTGRVVGTYRVLLPEDARRVGQLYIETEFNIAKLSPIRHDLIELGRSCVALDCRDGMVIKMLWNALAEFLSTRNERFLIGCVSVPMFDGGHYAASIFSNLKKNAKLENRHQVSSLGTFSFSELHNQCEVVLPALMRSYLKLGARVMGEPFYDKQFHCADFPMIVEAVALERKYGRARRRYVA